MVVDDPAEGRLERVLVALGLKEPTLGLPGKFFLQKIIESCRTVFYGKALENSRIS